MWIMIDEHEGEFETYDTEAEALSAAKNLIENLKDCDGWREEGDMQGIQVAKITYGAQQTNLKHKEDSNEDDWPNPEWDYTCDYEMQSITDNT